MRIGHGYDVHKLVPERDLILGGVKIPFQLGLLGHSDADVLLHAVSDALLGAAGLGDIGRHFPDTDPQYKDADSLKLLKIVGQKVTATGYRISNIDVTLIAQKPKVKDHIPAMQENIAAALALPVSRVNVKATTEEGLGFTGSLEGISCHAVCLLEEFR
ncbi:MAG: 2-C-methyl-D-erythritol 2,4-cyclodiphosphate synthase [Oscillospiraceae bacterium]|nr:2-C-methyl-D-erythritol 2,4-cyclodiphosphate synthase [Oscillospiraceae bacterium]